MSLVSTLASALYAALPQPLRCPSPRKSEGVREFDALIAELGRDQAPSGFSFDGVTASVTPTPLDGPTRALLRRAQN